MARQNKRGLGLSFKRCGDGTRGRWYSRVGGRPRYFGYGNGVTDRASYDTALAAFRAWQASAAINSQYERRGSVPTQFLEASWADVDRMNRGWHPCPFPESLAERVIKMYSWPTDLVIDPCCGTGTTTAVAARLGRRWLGIEVVETYARNAYARTMEEMNHARRRAEKIAKQIDEQPCAENAPTEGVTVAA